MKIYQDNVVKESYMKCNYGYKYKEREYIAARSSKQVSYSMSKCMALYL